MYTMDLTVNSLMQLFTMDLTINSHMQLFTDGPYNKQSCTAIEVDLTVQGLVQLFIDW